MRTTKLLLVIGGMVVLLLLAWLWVVGEDKVAAAAVSIAALALAASAYSCWQTWKAARIQALLSLANPIGEHHATMNRVKNRIALAKAARPVQPGELAEEELELTRAVAAYYHLVNYVGYLAASKYVELSDVTQLWGGIFRDALRNHGFYKAYGDGPTPFRYIRWLDREMGHDTDSPDVRYFLATDEEQEEARDDEW